MKEDSEKVKARNKRKTSKAKELGVCYAHLNPVNKPLRKGN